MTPVAPPVVLPPTMRAWVRQRRGPPSSVLKLVTDLPMATAPEESSCDVLIRVSHVSMQFSSNFSMAFLPTVPFSGPWIPELELSGEVVAAGSGAPAEVRDVGTHVIASQTIPNLLLGNGVMCGYIRLPGDQVARLDNTVDMVSASGVIGAGCTALKMIRTGGVCSGDTVLVNGASGSVGSMLVQICKLRGVKVAGVASGGNEAMVRALGVDQFIDYTKHESLPAYLADQYADTPFDFVLDCVGTQALFANSPAYLKPGGAVINIGAMEDNLAMLWRALANRFLPTWLGGVPRRYITFSTLPNRPDSVYLSQLLGEGRITVPVDSVFDFEDVVEAYERLATKRARGKVVIKVQRD